MKTIKILGTGCPNCKTTEEIVNKAINELNIQAKIEKVDDIMDIMKYDVMSTPAVVIDEKVMIKGRVPSVDEIKALLNKEESCCADTDSCCEPDSTDDTCCSDTDTSCCEPTDNNSSSCC
jgi:small redox-active disulfide protein 2